MTTQNFQLNYAKMSDTELLQVLADKNELLPEALSALENEVRKRQLSFAQQQPVWQVNATSGLPVGSLEDYDDYRRLRDKKRMTRWAHLVAIAPLVLVLFMHRWTGESAIFVLSACACAICICTCAVYLRLRFTAYKCPQCGDRFGVGPECRMCGFPRSKP